MKLKRDEEGFVLREAAAQMLHRLEQGIGLRTGGGRPLAGEQRAHVRQARAQSVQHMVEGVQRIGQAQPARHGLDRVALEQALQQGAQGGRPHGVPREDLGQEDGEAASAPAALAAIGAPHPLAALAVAFGAVRIVAVELAVGVEGFGSSALRAAELLERKSSAPSSSRLRAKRRSGSFMAPRCPNPSRRSSFFSTAPLAAGLGSVGAERGGGGAGRRGASAPQSERARGQTYEFSTAQKRRFLRRQSGP